MGMSSPKTKAEAREKIAKHQGEIARLRASLKNHSKTFSDYGKSGIRNEIASHQAKIAELRAKIPSLP